MTRISLTIGPWKYTSTYIKHTHVYTMFADDRFSNFLSSIPRVAVTKLVANTKDEIKQAYQITLADYGIIG